MSVSLKNAYASAGDMNVFVLDWGRLSGGEIMLGNTIRTMSAYRAVLSNVAPVGRRVAEFLSFLRDSKHINFYDVTIVGESLGAHVAANAAQAVKIVSGEKIGRVVGLDPAGPFTQNIKTLHKQDAYFVDIYHTNWGLLGTTSDAGHVNVYVNGGTSQPGCLQADFTGLMGFCSHSYSWRFFLAAFDKGYVACPCSIACKCPRCENICANGIIVGPNISRRTRGLYYVRSGPLA
ncbi:Endothelial lipase [Orchesella cincta]|uniref:Endothelial lipase n=1 Tax=Orchesella cincta TaxID=48709 RepID=A0A1D2M6F5_ORCCI|nr:Endothelial lipase [Orchesella cincta]